MKAVFIAMYWTWQGKRFGNAVADFMGVHRSLYHGAMEEGGCLLHMMKLHHLRQRGLPLELVAYDSCEFLLPGLICLEQRFGHQVLIDKARFKVLEYMSKECGNAGACFL